MKHCFNCGRISAGDPLFCNTCGRSFDKKLCPRHHPNPRSAEICSRCGSRELSTPQPNVSLGWKFLEWLMRMVIGALLLLLSVFLGFEVLKGLLGSPMVQGGLVLLGMLLFVLAWIWGKFPEWFRKFVRKQLHKRRDRHEAE